MQMWTVFALLAFAPIKLAMSHSGHDAGGMDMEDGAVNLSEGQMLMYFHFKPGDLLWFLGWVPNSVGAMVGASIGLFLLAMIERWIAACKGLMEAHWRGRTNAIVISRNRLRAQRESFASADHLAVETKDGLPASAGVPPPTPRVESQSQGQAQQRGLGGMGIAGLKNGVRSAPPFVWKHELLRGAMHAVHAALGYALMLAIMTYNLAFFLVICLGLGVGEMLFGRVGTHHHVG